MRIDEIRSNNKAMQKICNINKEEGRQMALLYVLTDISETLAIISDAYMLSHGIRFAKGDDNAEQ